MKTKNNLILSGGWAHNFATSVPNLVETLNAVGFASDVAFDECVYLHAFETGSQAKAGIGKWLAYYNAERPHSTHGILTPDEAYVSKTEPIRLAA